MTKIISCVCKNDYQDNKYGENKRVHNLAGGKDTKIWRCTSCMREERVSQGEDKKETKVEKKSAKAGKK